MSADQRIFSVLIFNIFDIEVITLCILGLGIPQLTKIGVFNVAVFKASMIVDIANIRFSFLFQMQCIDVAWHPEIATQLVLASEDDHAPVVQLWDLRFATSPMKVFFSKK